MGRFAEVDPSSASQIAATSAACCMALRARRMSRIITRIYDEALRPIGLTASQFTLLTQVAQQNGVTAAEIGFDLDIEKSTLSRNLKRLVSLKMIDMDPPAGRRGRGLHLTPKGQAVIKDAYPIWLTAQARAVGVLGPQSRGTLDILVGNAERLAAA